MVTGRGVVLISSKPMDWQPLIDQWSRSGLNYVCGQQDCLLPFSMCPGLSFTGALHLTGRFGSLDCFNGVNEDMSAIAVSKEVQVAIEITN